MLIINMGHMCDSMNVSVHVFKCDKKSLAEDDLNAMFSYIITCNSKITPTTTATTIFEKVSFCHIKNKLFSLYMIYIILKYIHTYIILCEMKSAFNEKYIHSPLS